MGSQVRELRGKQRGGLENKRYELSPINPISCGSCKRIAGVPNPAEGKRSQLDGLDNLEDARRTSRWVASLEIACTASVLV